jgi:hypothetical protein
LTSLGVPDPAEAAGNDAQIALAFADAFRIDLVRQSSGYGGPLPV